jgi:hypothetical protein
MVPPLAYCDYRPWQEPSKDLVLKGTKTMANEQKAPSSVNAAEGLLNQLKSQAEQAHRANDVFMMGVYSELIRVATPVVTKAVARYHREERARLNTMHKELRKQVRESKPQKSEA